MKIIPICPESFAANTYLLVSGYEAFIVDPSVSVSAIQRALDKENASLKGILLTHGHFDHTMSVDTLRKSFQIPLMMHVEDSEMLTDGKIDGFYDFYQKESRHKPADLLLNDRDLLSLGEEKIEVLSTPGHSPGSVCFLCNGSDGERFMITGDTLFSNSIGRSDLWRGDESTLARSLSFLSTFDKNMRIYAGHGPSSTLGAALEIAKYYIDFN